jgi:hypothetical protein
MMSDSDLAEVEHTEDQALTNFGALIVTVFFGAFVVFFAVAIWVISILFG